MYVIGTAGHVDHGKSTLVHALTGMDPDRLREEKEREMTIDLGFAWLMLPSGREISIVDVPGHERFIKNMLAGVGGIDAALLVIAADEGIMPQTQEHVAILDLLQIDNGVVALTKIDLVDEEWLELIAEDVRERLQQTSLAGSFIVPVSARTGQGLQELLGAIDEALGRSTPREDRGKPRLPVDRVFSISGFGTVVTGTLIDGHLEAGQEVEVAPKGLRTRIRGLQVHKDKASAAAPGNRVAVNISSLAVEDIERGDVLTSPGWLKSVSRVDVKVRVVGSSPKEIEQNDTLDFFTGAAEVPASVTVLDKDKLSPGEEGWLQIRLARPVAAAKGDRFILRQLSPSMTLGGGVIVDINPRRHRRFRPEVLESLETLARGTPAELVLQALESGPPVDLAELAARSGLGLDAAREAVSQLVPDERVLVLGKGKGETLLPSDLVLSHSGWDRLLTEAAKALNAYHKQFPLRKGMPKEELKSRLGLSPKGFAGFVKETAARGELAERNGVLALPQHEVRFNPAQQAKVDSLLAAFEKSPYAPSFASELGVDLEILNALQDSGRIVRVAEGVYFSAPALAEMRDRIVEMMRQNGKITVAEVRDEFQTSRKYALAVLEYLDETKITKRVGDERVLR